MEEKKVITDDVTIYVYFELIKRIAPKSILDFGMFLKRIGAVSRQAMNCEIPPETMLHAVDLFPETALPIYEKVYDRIDALADWKSEQVYELVCFFDVNEHLSATRKTQIWDWLALHAACVIADTKDPQFVQFLIDHFNAEAVETDGKTFAVAHRK